MYTAENKLCKIYKGRFWLFGVSKALDPFLFKNISIKMKLRTR